MSDIKIETKEACCSTEPVSETSCCSTESAAATPCC